MLVRKSRKLDYLVAFHKWFAIVEKVRVRLFLLCKCTFVGEFLCSMQGRGPAQSQVSLIGQRRVYFNEKDGVGEGFASGAHVLLP